VSRGVTDPLELLSEDGENVDLTDDEEPSLTRMTASSTVSGSVEGADSTITRNNDGVEMENEEQRPKRAKRGKRG
jgi:hypothetical protein